MPTPPYVLELRKRIGQAVLLLPGVTGIVLDADGRLLLGRRADNHRWALVGGIMEPGEEVAEAVVREVFEETALLVEPERITGVYTVADIVHDNGDRTCYVVTAFRCSVLSGEPRVNDDESIDVAFFGLDELPDLQPVHRELLEDALRDDPRAAFRAPARAATPGSEAGGMHG